MIDFHLPGGVWAMEPQRLEHGPTVAICSTCQTWFITTMSFPTLLWAHWWKDHRPGAAAIWAELRRKAGL